MHVTGGYRLRLGVGLGLNKRLNSDCREMVCVNLLLDSLNMSFAQATAIPEQVGEWVGKGKCVCVCVCGASHKQTVRLHRE